MTQLSHKRSIDLGDVQRTLLLPLWGRAVETRRAKPLLVDRAAAEIIRSIDYDFSTFAANIDPISQYAWICRSIHCDRMIKEFLSQHPRGTVVNVGCGLDTTFERVDNGALRWYDLDLPDVIQLRKNFIPESVRRTFIECSFLDDSWFRQVERAEPVMFMAAGVLYYFDEPQVREILVNVANKFPGSKLAFDACSPKGVDIANKKVIKDSGMSSKSNLRWGLDRADRLVSWDDRVRILEEFPMFKGMKKGLSVRNKLVATVSDFYKIGFMVRAEFLI